MLEQQRTQVLRNGSILIVLMMAAPVALQIIMEQMMGPGSSVSGGRLNGNLMIINFVLGTFLFINLRRALLLSARKKEE